MTTDGARGPVCPECDAPLDGNLGSVPANVSDGVVRLAVDCTVCAARLEVRSTDDGLTVDDVTPGISAR